MAIRRPTGAGDDAAKQITIGLGALGVIAALALVWLGFAVVQTIPPGHVGVATLFGQVQDETYDEGLHFVNPLLKFHQFDTRQKTHKETAGVPSQDQLTTEVDVSVQWRVIGEMAPEILRDTGRVQQLVDVHLVPKVRSLLRQQGKSIERAEDFFREETQQTLQESLLTALSEYLADKGIMVQDVLIRDINLPTRLIAQIEQKKEAEQQAERQKAELERFRTEQQQKVAQAEAERAAAEEEAERRKLIADAQAYEIERINEAIADSPAYIQLQALEALKSISKDPSAKLYFMNGQSPNPLPLMHLGDPAKSR